MKGLMAFLEGFASIFNIFPTTETKLPKLKDESDDYEAMKSDWEAIGKDFESVLGKRDDDQC
jgi:hypothetical protein